MAKTATAVATANRGSATVTDELSKKVLSAIETIRKPFVSYVKDFAALGVKRSELAPKFMKVFGMWQAETGGTFVAFVRYLAPEIGNTRQEYRVHPTYAAADYLRRLTGNAERRGPRTQAERAAAPAPPTDAIARIVAAFMAIIPEAQKGHLWEAMSTELHWTERQVARLQTQVEHVDPLVEIKGRTLENLRLSIPEPSQEREAA